MPSLKVWLVGHSAQTWYALAQYSIFRHIAKNDSKWGQAGYALGGAIGPVLAIYVTKAVFGK